MNVLQEIGNRALPKANQGGADTPNRRKAMNADSANLIAIGQGDLSQLDDFQVIDERRRATEAITALTNRYVQLNQEMTRRETLRWMVP